MSELVVDAKTENLEQVNDFIADNLMGCPMKLLMQIDLVVEEVFVNIANYAYKDKVGKAKVMCELDKENNLLTIVFEDKGVPFDPLSKEDPDITAGADEREIGGLGIFLTKKLMDEV
ncbi:MAG: ATP-binding protein, partial [Firmicutes bacterium]|nr:ATP-binding protein [Bacillota bacterium]